MFCGAFQIFMLIPTAAISRSIILSPQPQPELLPLCCALINLFDWLPCRHLLVVNVWSRRGSAPSSQREVPPASSFDSFISKSVCWILKGRLSVCSRESSGCPSLSLAAFMRNWTGLAWTFWYFNGFLRPDLTLLLHSHPICSDENWINPETSDFVKIWQSSRFRSATCVVQLPGWRLTWPLLTFNKRYKRSACIWTLWDVNWQVQIHSLVLNLLLQRLQHTLFIDWPNDELFKNWKLCNFLPWLTLIKLASTFM